MVVTWLLEWALEGRVPSLNGGVFSRRTILKASQCMPSLGWGYREWRTFYSQLVDLTVGALAVSLQLQSVDRLNARKRVQATPTIIQAFLRGFLCLNEKVDGKPAPRIASRSICPRVSGGLSPNFSVGFLDSSTPYLAMHCLLGGAPVCALHHTRSI